MSQSGKIKVGLCAMEKKVNSKPMKEILKGLEKASYIKLIIFSEKIILNEPIENWPICDALISFYSHNFPLDKAIDYAKLRKPYLINDLESQKILLNRKKVYSVLQSHGIPVPNHIVVDREKQNCELIDLDDAIEVNGQVIHKPFVEKPLDAENHNIYIYFPSTAGGGCQKLFRKIGDRSSTYSPESSVRMKGSFIYEDFMPTDGTDVKIYTVGDDYAHAEARKSPALDGKVERDHEGKEVRYPVILTLREKMMAKKVSQAVKQQICGFDLLRANGMSYVCDVNGFSFVKSSPKYYEDCAHILLMMITRHIAPQLFTPRIPLPTNTGNLVPTTSGSIMELRCVIGVIRHGDRTPKQKMKMEVKHEKFFQLFRKYSNERSSEVKLKKPKQLQEILDIVRDLLKESEKSIAVSNIIGEQRNKYLQLRNVLEMYGHFSGINRKIQMKYKPSKNFKKGFFDNGNDVSGLLLIIKWGGELTKAGRLQAEKLGRAFRRLYPGCNGDLGNDSGLGLLRLHSTYRHDLKIYASDEGRVQMTAAAFAKGFLALEGELPPILAQMVKSANTNGLLDNDNDCRQYQIMVKKKIYDVMSLNKSLTKSDMHKIAQTNTPSLMSALKEINNPVKMCDTLLSYLINLNLHLNEFSVEERLSIPLYHEETWELLLRRWSKLLKDFKPKDNYDLSKIPDIYDNIKYDIQHNPRILLHNEAEDLFSCAKALGDVIVPQEYGVTVDEKLVIGQRICTPLLRKILSDARYTDVDECTRLHAGYSKGVASPERFVRTRLYFTSESHLHALLNCIRYGDLANINVDEQWKPAMDYVNSVTELNYLSQIVIMIYEDPSHFEKELFKDFNYLVNFCNLYNEIVNFQRYGSKSLTSSKLEKDRFHVEIHFSPGALTVLEDQIEGTGYRPQNMERSSVLSRTDSNVSLTPNSKVISRQSSINEKQDLKFQSADEERDSGFNVKDLLSRLSRKKKIKASSRESTTKSNSSDIQTQFDFENVKGPQADIKSADINEDESPASTDNVSKFTVTPVNLSEADISMDLNDKNDNQTGFIKSNLGTESLKSKNTFLRKISSTKDEEDENQEMNYLTYPSRDISILNYLFQRQKMERKGSAKVCATSRPLISTEVIMGAKHYSTGSIPHINMLPELSEDGARYRNMKDEMNVPSAPCVPEIYPLETLHNALNLDNLEKFLVKLVSQKLPTPSASPK